MTALERIRRMIRIAVRLGYSLFLMFSLLSPAKLQAGNKPTNWLSSQMVPPVCLASCPPIQPNYYPFSDPRYCQDVSNSPWALSLNWYLRKLDSIYRGYAYNPPASCGPYPPLNYPYGPAPYCTDNTGSPWQYSLWWFVVSIDSVAGGGGGGGNLSGTLTPPHIPFASATHTLIDGPLQVSGSNVIIPAFLIGSTGTYMDLNGSGGSFAAGRGTTQMSLNPTTSGVLIQKTPAGSIQGIKNKGWVVTDSLNLFVSVSIPPGLNTDSILVYDPNTRELEAIAPSSLGNGWSLTGNAGTTPGTNFLGTTDAQDLVFKTNSTEIMRITSGGLVNVGTHNIGDGAGDILNFGNGTNVGLMDNAGDLFWMNFGGSGREVIYSANGGIIQNAHSGYAFQNVGTSNGAAGVGTLFADNELDYTFQSLDSNSKNVFYVYHRGASGNFLAIGTKYVNHMISDSGSIRNDSTQYNNTDSTTVSGSVSGTVSFSEVQSGTGIKTILVHANALNGTASYTFPVPFTRIPSIVITDSFPASIATSKSPTAITLTGTGASGYFEIIGN